MADKSSSLPPLCERISYKSRSLRAVDLTILGLLFSLLLYRIRHMSQNDTVWVVAFLCECCFTFIWLLITCTKWSPAEHKPYLDRLDERVHELPSVDMFVTTADPVREPPILVVNTVLSLLAVNYPANKLACYVSDDGCSALTYFSLKEASKFAKIWVPFCKKYNNSRDWEMTKREYEKLVQKVEDATGNSYWLDAGDDFEALSNTKPSDHSTIVKCSFFLGWTNQSRMFLTKRLIIRLDVAEIVVVIWENEEGVGDEKEVPHFVYISREKKPNYLHHYKAGAMNFLVRVSGLMTNAPYMLNVDCDMYANEADVVRQAMCIFMEGSMNPNHCAFVQFPQKFYDSNSDEIVVLQSYVGRGFAGIQGPVYAGSGCFHTRRVMYGLSVDDLEEDRNLSSVATRKLLAAERLERDFGKSKEMVKSVVDALQRKSNPQDTLINSSEPAQAVGHCHYEYQTSWGKTVGWLYDSTTEDAHTSIGIHSRGWTSSYISPEPPAFLGCMPPGGPEAMLQQRRWATGLLEILFTKQNPLNGSSCKKIRFRQSLAYLYIFTWGLRSIPELFYCLLPAYCVLHGSALFPKGVCLGIVFTLVGMHCLYTLWEFMSLGFSVHSCWLFSIPDIILKLLGVSNTIFIVTKKTISKTRLESGDRPSQKEDDGSNPDSNKFEFDGSLYFLPGTFILLVNLTAIAGFSMGLQRSSRSYGGNEGKIWHPTVYSF
ncbi:BnaA04g18860D [Brassica napus]|uniref:BnaA04g18860D protein n=1 Tax=Brassica napus TaxID=3708 RepID=A0A078G1H0_BRANA|nr:BnaA04g18860D [Brassica napus]